TCYPLAHASLWDAIAKNLSQRRDSDMNKLSLLTLFVGFLGAQSSAQQFTYVPINVQCATTATAESCPAGLMPGQVAPQTSAKGINARGDIVGRSEERRVGKGCRYRGRTYQDK